MNRKYDSKTTWTQAMEQLKSFTSNKNCMDSYTVVYEEGALFLIEKGATVSIDTALVAIDMFTGFVFLDKTNFFEELSRQSRSELEQFIHDSFAEKELRDLTLTKGN